MVVRMAPRTFWFKASKWSSFNPKAPKVLRERAAHTIKSSSASVGATTLSRLAGLVERQARNGLLDDVRQRLEEITRQFDSAARQLEKLREQLLCSQMDTTKS